MNGAHVVISELLNPEAIVAVVAPTVTFAGLTAIVALVLYFRYRSQRLRQDLYATFLERGAPIPEELLPRRGQTGKVDLRRGLVLLFGGLGLSLALLLAHETSEAGFGLIPALIGVGFLVTWKVESSSGADRAGL